MIDLAARGHMSFTVSRVIHDPTMTEAQPVQPAQPKYLCDVPSLLSRHPPLADIGNNSLTPRIQSEKKVEEVVDIFDVAYADETVNVLLAEQSVSETIYSLVLLSTEVV
jgi:hypothetical protein